MSSACTTASAERPSVPGRRRTGGQAADRPAGPGPARQGARVRGRQPVAERRFAQLKSGNLLPQDRQIICQGMGGRAAGWRGLGDWGAVGILHPPGLGFLKPASPRTG